MGHSHPNNVPLGMSGGDLELLTFTTPVDGKRRSTILDYTTGEIFVVELNAKTTAPINISQARNSGAPLSTQNRLMFWAEREMRQGNLTVRRLGDLTPGADTGSTPFLIFTGQQQSTSVDSNELKR
jgi:hypothetical protein